MCAFYQMPYALWTSWNYWARTPFNISVQCPTLEGLQGLPLPRPALQQKRACFKLDQSMNIFQNPQDTADPKHFSTGIFIGLSSSDSYNVCLYLFVVHKGRILIEYISSQQFDSISVAWLLKSCLVWDLEPFKYALTTGRTTGCMHVYFLYTIWPVPIYWRTLSLLTLNSCYDMISTGWLLAVTSFGS